MTRTSFCTSRRLRLTQVPISAPRRVERRYTGMFAPFGEAYRIEVEELIVAGDSVVVFHRASGRGRASGVEVEGLPTWGIYTMRGGKVIRIDHPANRAEAFAAVGLSGQDGHGES